MRELGSGTTILLSGVLSAIVSAVTTVSMQRALDIAFPIPQILTNQGPTGLNIPSLAYSFAFSAYADPSPPRLFGLVRDQPTYYYELSLGNSSDSQSGIINISIEFSKEFKSAAVFLSDRTVSYQADKLIHFQTTQLRSGSGKTIQIGVKSEDLPDINAIRIRITSEAGEFLFIPKNLYEMVFTSEPR